jgi:hypothetical protein
MPRARLLVAVGAAVAALASTLTLTAGTSTAAVPVAGAQPTLGSVAPTWPTNAAKIFRWGSAAWKDEFIEPLSEAWAVSDPSLVRNQNGMLTLEGTASSGAVSATVATHARRYGRWEARVRSHVRDTGGTPYRVVWELVPGPGDRCGDGITLASYSVGDEVAAMDIRTRPGAAFVEDAALDLGQYTWHTYAIEVTRDHISWFIDTKVVMTERRPEALSGRRLRMRFRLVPVDGARMDSTRMQMDWARYYTMARPGVLPVDAPEAQPAEFTSPC